MNEEGGTRALVRHTAIVMAVVTLFLVGWLLLREAFSFILLLFAGVLFGVFLDGGTRLLRRYVSFPRAAALAAVVGILIALVGLFFALLGPDLIRQLVSLWDALPGAVADVRGWLGEREWGQEVLDRVPGGDGDGSGDGGGGGNGGGNGDGDGGDGSGGGSSLDLFGRAASLFSTTFGAFADVLIVLFLGLYFAISPSLYVDPLVRLLPRGGRDRAGEVVEEAGSALRSWLGGRLASMAVVAVLTAIGLFVLGVPMALGLAILAGLLSFVPFLGPLVAAIPAILVAFGESPSLALWVGGVYLAVQIVESYLLLPLIQQRAVSLPPSALLAAQIIMGIVAGLLGVLLATPLTVVMVVFVEMLYVEDVLGEEISLPGS